MAPLPKGPYTVKIDYAALIGTQTITHTQELNCTALGAPPPGTASTVVMLATRSGGSIAFSTAAQEWWDRMRLQYNSPVTLVGITLWRYDGPGIGDTFISTAVGTPAAGVSGGAPTAGHQTTLTFRTGLGKIMKILLMETSLSGKAQGPLINGVATPVQRMCQYVMSASGWMCGRGGSWPVAPLKESQTYNEALEERRFRPF